MRRARALVAVRLEARARRGARHCKSYLCAYGRNVPARDFTMEESPLLTVPSVFTSERKLVAPAACPERLRVCVESPALTNPSPLVSPASRPIGMPRLPVFVPSFTPNSVMVIFCAFATPGKIHRHLITGSAGACDQSRARSHGSKGGRNGRGKRDDHLVIIGCSTGATFNSRTSGERQIDAEVGGSMCFSETTPVGLWWRRDEGVAHRLDDGARAVIFARRVKAARADEDVLVNWKALTC